MAATQFYPQSFASSSHFGEPDLDRYINFEMASPGPSTTTPITLQKAESSMQSPLMEFAEEPQQTPAKPAHDYGQFKQQVGVPTGSISTLMALDSQSQNTIDTYDFDTLDETDFTFDGMNMNMDRGAKFDINSPANDLPAFFYPNDQNDFIDPSSIQDEQRPATIRYFPGMHQQAALAKAQAEQKQTIEQRQPQKSNGKGKQPMDQHSEETIARVINQIRRNSSLPSNESGSPSPGVMSHSMRIKKDEDDMDEDERLLASEEGKKLSSKERRQLRNKVSARAFRSRRKEYISQLESEVSSTANEINELKRRNAELMAENARSRNFINLLLHHQAFQPFLEDLSRDPTLSETVPNAQAHIQQNQTPSQKDVGAFPASQMIGQAPASENPTVGMAMIPEQNIDFSQLNITGNGWGVQQQSNVFGFQQPRVFAVLELPEGPAEPLDMSVLSGKGADSFLKSSEAKEETKPDYPVINFPVTEHTRDVDKTEVFETEDPAFSLYVDSPVTTPTSFPITPVNEKPSHFELVVSSDYSDEDLEAHLRQMCAAIEPIAQRIQRF